MKGNYCPMCGAKLSENDICPNVKCKYDAANDECDFVNRKSDFSIFSKELKPSDIRKWVQLTVGQYKFKCVVVYFTGVDWKDNNEVRMMCWYKGDSAVFGTKEDLLYYVDDSFFETDK